MSRLAEWLVIPVTIVLLVVLFLHRDHWGTQTFGGHRSIRFYPGQYARVVLNSGEAVSAAMKAVYAASDPAALNAAIANVQKMVDAGDTEAAFRLGRFYHLESAEPNYELALKYYETAVYEQHAWATNNLGILYREGLGVRQDLQKAYDYFEQASRHKNPWAYTNLAAMTGSIEWLEKGALPTDSCRHILTEQGIMFKKHLQRGVKKGLFNQEQADTQYTKWVTEKGQKHSEKKDAKLTSAKEAYKARIAAETTSREAKAKAIAAKKAAAAEAAAPAATEAPAAEPTAPAAE